MPTTKVMIKKSCSEVSLIARHNLKCFLSLVLLLISKITNEKKD